MTITAEDREWLTQNQPGLVIHQRDGGHLIEGRFNFFAAFDELAFCYRIEPSEEDCARLVCLGDSYEVEIIVTESDDDYPLVRESAGRILRFAETHGMEPQSLHIYLNGRVCLVGPFDEDGRLSLREFIQGPLLQFFYDQTYFTRYGRWPRGEYAHGVMGLLENYCDRLNRDQDGLVPLFWRRMSGYSEEPIAAKVLQLLERRSRIKGQMPCLCESDRPFASCHPKALAGLRNLHRIRWGR